MDAGDWRSQIPAGDRQMIVDEIMNILKRDVPFIEHEEIRQSSIELEESFFAAATSQSDYMAKLSSELADWETVKEDHMAELLKIHVGYKDIQIANPDHVPGMDAGDWRDRVKDSFRLKIIIKIINVLKRDFPSIPRQSLEKLKNIAVRMERRNFTTATSKSDYMKGLTWKLLSWEKYRQDHMADSLQTSSWNNSKNPADIGKPFFEEIAAIVTSGARQSLVENVAASDPSEAGKQVN